MAAARPRTLQTDEEVTAAVDELLGAFAAPPDAQPDDTGFEEEGVAPKLKDADALWGAPKKKPKK